MSINVATSLGSLVSIGFSYGDAAALWATGKNFLSIQSDDAKFLSLLDLDDLEILRRRGIFDLLEFNKKWSEQLNILVNGQPQRIEGVYARSVQGEVGRFSACMMCIVAALDQAASMNTVERVMKELLRRLLQTHEAGEALIETHLRGLVQAWRSSAVARGLTDACRDCRISLLARKIIQGGRFLEYEANEMADFLYWLLVEDIEEYSTNSSDVFGLGACLSSLGFDTLSLKGLGFTLRETNCRLEYTEDPLKLDRLRLCNGGKLPTQAIRRRWSGTFVSLLQPEEAFTAFPVDSQTANRCRLAWKSGVEVSKFVRLTVDVTYRDDEDIWTRYSSSDLQYKIVISGNEVGRVSDEVSLLAEFSLGVNKELCQALEAILATLSPDGLKWFLDALNYARNANPQLSSLHSDNVKLSPAQNQALCIIQAFYMGYYYSIFLPLVDTSSLRVQVVDGCWGYRNLDLLLELRNGSSVFRTPSVMMRDGSQKDRLLREYVLMLIAKLVLGEDNINILTTGRVEKNCVGIIGVRTLLCNSLIKTCNTPADIAKFTLLDVDTSGIPRNYLGLVHPGIHETQGLQKRGFRSTEKPKCKIRLKGPDSDLTKHIEPDWTGNPEHVLLTMRYKGRRVGSVNPALTDLMFCLSYTTPVSEPRCQVVDDAFECCLEDLLDGRIFESRTSHDPPTIIQAYNCPCMQYAAVGWLGRSTVVVASNCIQAAIRNRRKGSGAIIAGYK